MAAVQAEETPLHPYYSLLPSYITQASVFQERDEFVGRVRETLAVLQHLRDGTDGDTKLQKKHFRSVETLFNLKHGLAKTTHKELIESLVWHLWENDAALIVDVDMEVRAVQTLRLLLSKWTSKVPPSERAQLVLQWKLAKKAIDRVCFSSPGLTRLASPVTLQLLATGMVKCVEKARPFFGGGASVAAELWSEFATRINDVKSNDCFQALGYFTLFFNIPSNASDSDWGVIEPLVPLWLQSWSLISRCADWDGHWFKVLGRVTKRFPVQIAILLRDAMAFVFAKVHDLLELPSDLGSPFKSNTWPAAYSVLHGSKRFDQHAMRLCAYLLGNPTEDTGSPTIANQYVVEILTTVKPFFHPSNASSAANTLGIAVYYLSSMIAKRLGAEKASKELLKVESCRDIFDVLLQLSYYGIYSKNRSVASKSMYLIKSLICVDPAHCARPVLEEMVKALDPTALSQSHMAPAAISSLSVFLYHLMCGQHPNGPGLLFSTYLAPLLRLTLPGIDPNDDKKTMATLTLYFHVLSWLPLVNDVEKKGGESVRQRGEVSNAIFKEMEPNLFGAIVPNDPSLDRKTWELGSFLEEWSLSLLDRCLEFIRSRANTQAHDIASKNIGDNASSHHARGEDQVVLEVLNMMSLLYGQMSPAIYTQALRKTVTFVSNSFFTSAFGGKVISTLVFDCLQGDVEQAMPQFLRIVLDKLQVSKASALMANEKVWYLHILDGAVRFNSANHAALLAHRDELRAILAHFLLQDEEKEVYEAAGAILEQLLHALVGVYPLDFRSLPRQEWEVATSESTGMFQFLGAALSWKRLDLQWHEPCGDELSFAYELLQDHLLSTFKALEQLRADKDVTVRHWIPHLKRIYAAVRGTRNILVDTTGGPGALQAGSMPLLTRACGSNIDLLDAFIALKSMVLVETHATSVFWHAHGNKGVTENQVWNVQLKVIMQLLVWRGSHLGGHRSKEKQNMYIKATTSDVPSRQLRKVRRFDFDPLTEVPLSSRNEMTERVLFFYSKRKVQEHFKTAHHVLSDGSSTSVLRAQYESLLSDVDDLMKHPYEEVRNSANGVMRESTEIFAKWMYSRISKQLDVLEGKSVGDDGFVKEEVVSGAVEFIRRPLILTYFWKSRETLLERALTSVLGSNETVVKKLESEASKTKVGLKIQAFFLALLASWRYVRNGSSQKLISAILASEPAVTEHWKQQLMHMVCLFPLLQPQEMPMPLSVWQLFIKQIRHEVLPVRQVALLLLSQLVKLHKWRAVAGEQSEVDALLFSDETLKALVGSMVNNHRNTHRFAASADGQHANSAPSDWSFGVNEVIRYLSNTSSAYPKAPPLSSIRLLSRSIDSFKSTEVAHIKLVQRLTQMNPRAITQGCILGALEGMTAGIGSNVSDEDRQASLSTLGEWVGGMLRGVLKLPSSESDVAASAVKMLTGLLEKILPHVNLSLVDPWAQVLYYVARPSNNRLATFQVARLDCLVSFVLNELDQAFARATLEDYANQVKWLSLVEPLLVLVLGSTGPSTQDSQGLITLQKKIRDTVVRVIDTHALAHRYKMVRDRVAKTLFILDVNDREDEARPTQTMLKKLVELTQVQLLSSQEISDEGGEEDTDSLSAKETAMQWLVCADRHGDTRDFVCMMKSLFPIAFLTQNHSKVEIALLAKNTTNAISLSLRLHAPPADKASAEHLNDLIDMLELFSAHQLWKTRAAVLRFLTLFTFYHWIFFSPQQQERVQKLVMSFLADEQREVQDMAKYALRSLAHIQRTAIVHDLSRQLTEQAADARVKHPKLVRRLQKQEQDQPGETEETEKTKSRIKNNEKKMATSILGMSAIVLAFPYSVPSFVPPLFEEMGRYLYIKFSTPTVSFLEKSVKDTLLEFKRTHQDNWLEIKNAFTQQQRDVFEDVIISPSYYT